jgi:hypothetical protein
MKSFYNTLAKVKESQLKNENLSKSKSQIHFQ